MIDEVVTIKPDMRVIHPEYGDITEDVARELANIRREDHEKLVKDAVARNQRIAAARPGQAVVKKGFALKAEIDPAVHAYWRMREGPGFWKNELEWYLKKNPECRVKSVSEKAAVNFGGHGLPQPRRTGGGSQARRGRWAT